MVNNGTLHARIINTHDVEANWNKTLEFIPREGELIIYDQDDQHNYARFKIGDGKTDVKVLPFLEDTFRDVLCKALFGNTSNDVIYLDGGNIKNYK